MRRVRIAHSAAEMEALRPLWLELERTPAATVFQSYAWNLAAARHFAERERPHIVAVESDNGAAIIPAGLRVDGVTTLLGEMLFDYRDLLAVGDIDLGESLAALDEVASLWVPAVRQDSLIANLERGTCTEWVGAPCLRARDVSPEAFLVQHFKARKQTRRLLRAGARFERHGGNVPRLVAWIYERKAEQFAGSAVDIFSDPQRRHCMQSIIAATPARCHIFTVEAGSAIVAALITFQDGGVRRFYTIWHDPAWQEFSPGIVLMLHVCHETLREGMDVDFLTGEQPHKARFATSRVLLYQFHASAEELRAAAGESQTAA